MAKNKQQSSPQPNQKRAKDSVKLRGKNGFNYRPKWAVIVICDGDSSQQQTYESLKSQGYTCRVVNV